MDAGDVNPGNRAAVRDTPVDGGGRRPDEADVNARIAAGNRAPGVLDVTGKSGVIDVNAGGNSVNRAAGILDAAGKAGVGHLDAESIGDQTRVVDAAGKYRARTQ